jgi:hypothetical protein
MPRILTRGYINENSHNQQPKGWRLFNSRLFDFRKSISEVQSLSINANAPGVEGESPEAVEAKPK